MIALQSPEAARDAAIATVEANSGKEWQQYALGVIRNVASAKPTFTTDDVVEAIEILPHDMRAIGATMRRAAHAGLIVKTGEYQPSRRRHCTPLPVWKMKGVQ